MRQMSFDSQVQDCFLASDSDWRKAADRRVRDLALEKQFFTSEAVLVWLEEHGYKTKDKRALGAIMQHYAKAGIIRAHGYAQALRPERHKAPVRVWESLITKERATNEQF